MHEQTDNISTFFVSDMPWDKGATVFLRLIDIPGNKKCTKTKNGVYIA